MTKHRFKIYISYLALVFGILFLLSGCDTKSPELEALETSVSVLTLKTGGEVSRAYQDKGVTLGKPVYAQVRIEYEPLNHYTKDDVYDEIVAILEKNSWERDEWNIVPDYFSGSLQQGHFTIYATVLIQSDKNSVTVYMEIH